MLFYTLFFFFLFSFVFVLFVCLFVFFLMVSMYECALLQNRKCGTPVIPVFVAEKAQSGEFVAFDFGKAAKILPDVPHARKSRASNMISHLRYKRDGRA
jgi:hypothetical protein